MMYKLYYDENETYPNGVSLNGDDKKRSDKLDIIRVVVIGDYMVGKSKFVDRLCLDKFNDKHETTTTVQKREMSFKLRNGQQINVELFDTPGLDQHRENLTNIYRKCHGAIVMYDVGDSLSFNIGVPKYLEQLKRTLPPNSEILLVGAKSDSPADQRYVAFKEADEFAARQSLSLFEVSSKTDVNVKGALNELVQRVFDRYNIGTFDPATMVITDTPSDNKSKMPMFWSFLCCWVH